MDDKDLEKMTPEELREVRSKIAKLSRKYPYVAPGTRIYGYLSEDYGKHLNECVMYAKENNYIKEKKIHNFVSWCVKKIIRETMFEINQKKWLYTHNPDNSDPEPLID